MKNRKLCTGTAFLITLTLLADCGSVPNFKAAKATLTRVETSVATTKPSGTVDAEQQAALGFSASGRISRILVRLGDRVHKGQILAELDNSDLRSLNDNAVDELNRSKELFDSGLVSKVAYDEAKKNREVAQANLDKSRIVAPFDGVITEQNLELGGLSQNTTKTQIRIIDMKPRIVKGDIDEVDLAKVHIGDTARVKIQAVRPQPFEAVVRKVVPYVSTTKESDRTSQIELQIKDTSTLIPVGASADVEIIVAAKDDTLALPARTLLGAGDTRYVFLDRDGKATRTTVKVGIGNYDRVEILSGVTAGQAALLPSDEVELKDGMKVKAEIIPWP